MFVKELTGTSAVNPMPDEESDQKLSEEFANFFLSKIHKIRESLDEYLKYDPAEIHCSRTSSFREATQVEVISIKCSMKNKTAN